MKRYPFEAVQPAETPAAFEPEVVQEAANPAPRQQPLPFEYTPSAPPAGMPPASTPAEFELSQQHLDSMRVSNRVLEMLSPEPSKASVDTQEAKQSVQQASPGEPDAAPPQDESAPGDLPAAIPGPTPVVVPAQHAQAPEQSEPAPLEALSSGQSEQGSLKRLAAVGQSLAPAPSPLEQQLGDPDEAISLVPTADAAPPIEPTRFKPGQSAVDAFPAITQDRPPQEPLPDLPLSNALPAKRLTALEISSTDYAQPAPQDPQSSSASKTQESSAIDLKGSEPAPSYSPLKQQQAGLSEEAQPQEVSDALLSRRDIDVDALLADVRKSRKRRFLRLEGMLPLLSEEG